MLELASVGAKVLQTRSVGLAMRHNLPLQVLSSFRGPAGTLIVSDERLQEVEWNDPTSPASPMTRMRRW
jgi:aspartate kinase